jgi:hypothetical protein
MKPDALAANTVVAFVPVVAAVASLAAVATPAVIAAKSVALTPIISFRLIRFIAPPRRHKW